MEDEGSAWLSDSWVAYGADLPLTIDRALWPEILRGCRLQKTVSDSVESEFVEVLAWRDIALVRS
jgi:hypothetical protein